MDSKQTPRSSILRNSSGELSASSRRSFASTSTHTSSVSFDHVTVREYEVTIGDNPSCSSGAPVSIDWDYCQEQNVSIDSYEANRPPRRRQYQLRMSKEIREDILLQWNYSLSCILLASQAVDEARSQRAKSFTSFSRRSRVFSGISNVFSFPSKASNCEFKNRQQKVDETRQSMLGDIEATRKLISQKIPAPEEAQVTEVPREHEKSPMHASSLTANIFNLNTSCHSESSGGSSSQDPLSITRHKHKLNFIL